MEPNPVITARKLTGKGVEWENSINKLLFTISDWPNEIVPFTHDTQNGMYVSPFSTGPMWLSLHDCCMPNLIQDSLFPNPRWQSRKGSPLCRLCSSRPRGRHVWQTLGTKKPIFLQRWYRVRLTLCIVYYREWKPRCLQLYLDPNKKMIRNKSFYNLKSWNSTKKKLQLNFNKIRAYLSVGEE